MMGAPEVLILLGLWAVVAFALTVLVMEGQTEAHSAVLWPIALVKWLLVQLYLVLFTGWKP